MSQVSVIKQNLFPNAFIEDKWNRVNQIRKSPSYAVRIALGAHVTPCPNSNPDFVSLTFEGHEYVLHVDNYKLAKSMAEMVSQKWQAEGFVNLRRYHPNTIIDSLYWLTTHAISRLDLPLEKIKMLWWLPDFGVCGEYRSHKPYLHMEEFWAKPDQNFYAEHTKDIDPSSIDWFDVIMMHRIPPAPILSMFQRLHAAGKFMVYEYDDDLFNVPDWNLNSKKIGIKEQAAARACIDMADLIICSTEELMEVSNRPDVCMHGPNLVDINEFQQATCNRQLNTDWAGYSPVTNNKRIEWRANDGKRITRYDTEGLDPIRILWAGSNTHEKDLEQIIPAVVSIGKKYGPAVRFIFFGYIPLEFVYGVPGSGNVDVSLEVKPEYQHFISYIPPVEVQDYSSALRSIDPDFALCPLADDIFNLSKSNLKVLEMGAMGVPCIASDFGPYRFINHGVDGIKVTLKKTVDRLQWFNEIEKCILLPEERNRFGQAMYKRVLDEFCWNTDSSGRRKWDNIFGKIIQLSTTKKEASLKQIAAMFPEAFQPELIDAMPQS